MASKLEEKNAANVILNPCMLNLIEIWLAVTFCVVLGNSGGFTERGPLVSVCMSNVTALCTLTAAQPKETPYESVISLGTGDGSAASSNASFEAANANFVPRVIFLNPLLPNKLPILKGAISPAILHAVPPAVKSRPVLPLYLVALLTTSGAMRCAYCALRVLIADFRRRQRVAALRLQSPRRDRDHAITARRRSYGCRTKQSPSI